MNDGGPAFPCDENNEYKANPGMSLRAYFAGQAMQGMLAGRKCELGYVNLADMTESATKVADALIAALEVKHE